MSLILQNPLSNSTSRKLFFPNYAIPHFTPSKTLTFSLLYQNHSYPLHKNFTFLHTRFPLLKPHNSSSSIHTFQEQQETPNKLFNFDAFLSFLESLFVVSSVVIVVGYCVNWVFFKQYDNVWLLLGKRLLVWVLAGAVAVGSVIRRRQWSRVCGTTTSSRSGSETGNVIDRIEKLEESMKSATCIIRMLSKQLEKLGVRFRVTRKSLKDPVSETAALAQKNSEATRALAAQEGILEKELAEVQKVLLAMQDQQQKQLELILAVAKSAKLFETKQAPSQGPATNKTVVDKGSRQVDGQQIQAMAAQKGATNDSALGS